MVPTRVSGSTLLVEVCRRYRATTHDPCLWWCWLGRSWNRPSRAGLNGLGACIVVALLHGGPVTGDLRHPRWAESVGAGLVASGTGAVAVWTDTRAGNDVSLKQDLARAVADVTDPRATSATATAVQALGVVGVLAGVVVLGRTHPAPSRHSGVQEDA